MSMQGKKIAQINMAFHIAQINMAFHIAQINMAFHIVRSVMDMNIKAHDMHALVAYTMCEANKRAWFTRSAALSATPHQYFNSKGKIDKRKVRRHERSIGMKPHTTRILRPKIIGVDMANGKDASQSIVIAQDDMKLYGTYEEYEAVASDDRVGHGGGGYMPKPSLESPQVIIDRKVTHRCCPTCGHMMTQQQIELIRVVVSCPNDCGKTINDYQPFSCASTGGAKD